MDVGALPERLLRDFDDAKTSDEDKGSHESLEKEHAEAFKSGYKDERLYKEFGGRFMERHMWREALRDLHCRLFLLDKSSKDYDETMEMIRAAQHNLLADVMPIPVAFKEMLFVRDLEEKWSRWISQMGYTEQLRNVSNDESMVEYHANTLVTKVRLRPGSLLMRVRPFVVAPWRMDASDSNAAESATTLDSSCFHCLSVIRRTSGPYYESTTLVSCPCKPYECLHVFCSEDCFLYNGAVHVAECKHLVKLKSFAANVLNETLVLLVVRTLIRCGLCRDKNSYKPVKVEEGAVMEDKNDVLQRILKVNVDYSVLESKHQKVLEEVKMLAHFLLEELGVKFCLYLTHRELAHVIVVLWTKSVPLTPEVYVEFENAKLGGVAFSLNLFGFQQSREPTLTVYFDGKGRISMRSIYQMEPGTRLYINTSMDKYLPPYKQDAEFWSVGLLLSSAVEEVTITKNSDRDVSSVRCGGCIRAFCRVASLDEAGDGRSEDAVCSSNYVWACESCSAPNQGDLNLLQKKAEDIILRIHRLLNVGQHLVAKKMLENFVWRWSGVLHPNHYLMYNAHVLLAGIRMNKAGSNMQAALNHLTSAILMAEEMLPLVCHEKAHLYSRLADLMGQLVMTARVNRKEDMRLKQMTIEAAYTALWNWTVIAGAKSREAVMHMQKCRNLAFQINFHAPILSNNFVINVPGKYLEVFKLVTGNCVIPAVLRFSTAGNLADVPTDNVAAIAFMAAQSGTLTDAVLEVLMSIESYGIVHLGTGLSVLGIVASNGNVEMVKAITESIHTRVANALEYLAKNDNAAEVEATIANLLLSLVGGNELGITPLMAMASVPAEQDAQALKNEIIISRLIIECAEACDEIIARHKNAVALKLGSLKWFMESATTMKALLLEARTHAFLKGQTTMHYAASKGKRNLVQYLARMSGNVNQMNSEGATPLHLAALGGHRGVCETLISFGAKQNVALATGEWPIHLAIYALHEPTVKLFLDNYARRAVESANTKNTCIGKVQPRGPSIWHALVAGIYRHEDGTENEGISLEVIVARLTNAVQIAQLLAENTTMQEIYVWADATPSQVLWKKWQAYMEENIHRFDPRGNFQRLNLANVNTLLHGGDMGSDGTGRCRAVGEETDAVFAATRAVQFLSQLLRRAEESAVDAVNQHVVRPAAPADTG
ncbi:histone lysine methyltransferase, SET, putative [Babesia caballi]|uniref:Histone lysine methyltransferase, SET, putative n=1 Tax=Babesia caballi TaxID=5871 RepID=A0AAV4LY32_BABCB|nr:histone lysine methyltransferase, SET, putative [Babesia caballi]